jgi:hypothetical protein
VALVVVILSVVVVQLIFSSSYNENIGKLKGMVATAAGQLEKGDETAGATLTDEYRFYATLHAQIDNLSSILVKLNDSYPLLFFRTNADVVGLTALSAKMDELLPQMKSLKTCADEDKAIAGELSSLLGGESAEGLAGKYSGLITRNDKLKLTVSGLSFSGAAETGRAAFETSITTRGKALECLREDASINEELALLLADFSTPVATISSKLNDLQTKSDTLAVNMQGMDLTVYNPAAGKIADLAGSRSARIKIDIDYLGQIAPLQSSVATFCAGLETTPAGKLTAKMAVYIGWLKQLQTLQVSLDTINADAKYADADKLSIENLGMTPAGKELLSGKESITALNAALVSSASIESKISSIMKNTKTKMPDKVTALTNLIQTNNAVITALSGEAPAGLKEQLDKYIDGCKERAIFLDDYANYLIAKDNSDTIGKIASKGGAGAAVAKQQYRDALKITNECKAKYEASRKNYLSMLDV